MRLLYFASVREAIGFDEEERDLPGGIDTPARLLDWLIMQDEKYAGAFANRSKLRCAIEQRMARLDDPLGNAQEIAFFPPVTGG